MNIECSSNQDRQTVSAVKASQTVRVRPFDIRFSAEVCNTENVSETALYFETSFWHYYEGMNVSVARNFHADNPTHREEPAKIVRVDKLSDGKWGVAVCTL